MFSSRRCRALLLAVFCFLPGFASAADFLFVFHGGAEATVYNPRTLDFAATAEVGSGALDAIGVPDPEEPTDLLKIYVIRPNSVAVLNPDPPFTQITNLPLPAAVNLGEQSAQLSPDGRWLLIAAGNFLVVFDATAPGNPPATELNLAGRVTGFAVLPNSERAYATVLGSRDIEIIGLTGSTPQRLAGPITLAEPPAVIGVAPNARAIYAGFATRLFEIDQATTQVRASILTSPEDPSGIVFDPGAPVTQALLTQGNIVSVIDLPDQRVSLPLFAPADPLKVITPGSDVFYALGGNPPFFSRRLPGAGISPLANPQTGSGFALPAVDMEVGPGARDVLFAFGGGAVVVLDPLGQVVRNEVEPPQTPTGIAVVSTPAPLPASLEIYGGDGQVAGAGSELTRPLAVRALGPNLKGVAGTVTFSSNPAATFRPRVAETNRFGVAQTRVVAPIPEPFEVEARLSPGDLAVTFNLNSGGEGEEGLSKVSGDLQFVLGGTDLPLPFEVLAIAADNPVAGLELTITPSSADLTCPATATTDFQGVAAFTCSAAAVTERTQVTIDVQDGFGRELDEPFEVTIVDDPSELPSLLHNLGPNFITGTVRQRIEEALRFQAVDGTGQGVIGVGASFSSMGDVSFDPVTAVSSGLAGTFTTDVIFGCSVERSTIDVTLHAPETPTLTVGYETMPGPPALFETIQGDGLAGDPGERLDGPAQALRARLSDECGNPLANQPVEWSVEPPGALTLDRPPSRTNSTGQVSTLVVLGSTPGAARVTVSSGPAQASFLITINAVAAQAQAAAGNNQSVPAGGTAAEPLVAEFLDSEGGPVEGIPVELEVVSGEGTVLSPQGVTDEQGRVSTGFRAGGMLGPVLVEARGAGLAVQFMLTVAGRVPMVSSLGFVNGASFAQGWTPGSTATIFGEGLMEGVEGAIVAGPGPFPAELRGVRVLVEGVPAPILGLANINGQEQINLQVPVETPAPAEVDVTVDNNGSTAAFRVRTFAVQPGIFEFDSEGTLLAAALHADFRPVTPEDPAVRGETILLFWTGAGQTDPPFATNQTGPVPPLPVAQPATVTLGGQPAQVRGSFLAPFLLTVFQTNFVVPEGVEPGLAVLQIGIGGESSQEALLPVGGP